MALDNLDSPLRLTWDICPPNNEALSSADFMLVADRLVDAGLFYLSMAERPLLHPDLPEVLAHLSRDGCQVSLAIGDDPAELSALKAIGSPYSLLVEAACWLDQIDGLNRLEGFLVRLQKSGLSPSLSWVPESGRLDLLYPLFEICRRQGIPRFKLPNHKIGVNSGAINMAGLLQFNDLELLAQMLESAPLDAGNTALEVHDLFLWELLFPEGGGERSEYGGCQAGNSLGHISVAADVWPCSSWPQALGNLLQEDLLSIWESPDRYRIRAEVAAMPADCAGCGDAKICLGGCRGLAMSCRSDDAKRDLLCPGPRNTESI